MRYSLVVTVLFMTMLMGIAQPARAFGDISGPVSEVVAIAVVANAASTADDDGD